VLLPEFGDQFCHCTAPGLTHDISNEEQFHRPTLVPCGRRASGFVFASIANH